MKMFIALITLAALHGAFAQDFATESANEQILHSETINVEGYVKDRPIEDHEIQSIRREIQKQKKEIVLNKVKSKHFKALTKSTEQLSETTVEYLEEKKEAQAQIAEYNLKVRCLQTENPGKECEKFVRRR